MNWEPAILVGFAAVPAALIVNNLRHYRRPPAPGGGERPCVSILIPARNEEASIARSVESARASIDIDVEILVLDDESSDRTVEIVDSIAAEDPRVKVVKGVGPPPGWCGKQFACWSLAARARGPYLLFMDADTRLAPTGAASSVAFLEQSRAQLVSGVPRQETVTFSEKLFIPLVHFILLGFLPIKMSRESKNPAFAAGCGQLFLTTKEAYARARGHAAIRGSLHDGIQLPRAYRRAGLTTDLFDATDVAACRMYRDFSQLWQGFAKNAREGLAHGWMILLTTMVLLIGQVLPFVALVRIAVDTGAERWGYLAALALAWFPRLVLALRFHQSLLGAALHPIGILTFLAIQWYALCKAHLGRPALWKGRPYPMVNSA